MSLYHGGPILTMTGETAKYVEAVVVKDEKIAFTGSLAEAKTRFPDAKHENLEGRTMMPGLIDPHLHPSMGSLILRMHFITPFDWTLPSGFYPGVRTKKEYRGRLKELIANYRRNPKQSLNKEFLITWGYHNSFHGKMSRKFLDKRAGDIPVVVWHRSFHELYLNTFALDQLEYDSKDDLMSNGQVDWENGHFFEMGLDALLNTTSFNRNHVRLLLEDGYKDLVQVVHQGGITAVADLEFPLLDLEDEKEQANDKLKSEHAHFSTYCVASGRNFARLTGGDHQAAIKQIKELAKSFSDDQVILYDNHIKALADGAFYSQLMQMKEKYLDGHEGEWITEPDKLAEMMEVYWRKEFQIHVHTNGDLGMEEVLKIVEDLSKRFPRKNHRTTIEHAGYFTEDQADKIARLGVMVSAAPYYFYTLAEEYSGDDALGPDRARAIAPLRWLFDKAVPTALHSDFTMAPAQPLLLAWSAVNRVTAENHYYREDLKITPFQGMLGITKNAAIIMGTDDVMGTIEQDKFANFTILNENPLEVKEIAIKDIKIHATVYKGKMNKLENQ